jgi:hypothetical protein
VSIKFVGIVAGLICAWPAVAAAQNLQHDHTTAQARVVRARDIVTDSRATLESSVAHATAKAVFSPQQAPSREELIGILLFMSLRNSKGHGA